MLETPWIAVLGALFLWWFCTGILLWRVHRADRGGPDEHIYSALLGLPLLAAGVLGVNATLGDASAQGVWLAFLSALALWGWIELAFLSGVITGPIRAPARRICVAARASGAPSAPSPGTRPPCPDARGLGRRGIRRSGNCLSRSGHSCCSSLRASRPS
jgi:hypothetical protein